MEPYQATTPFGRRSLALAHMATQIAASHRPPEKVVHKWKLFQTLCTARPRLGVSERALAVLNALLTFHPETTLTGDDDLIVFPSNQQLMLRAHGMAAATLRRHLAALVDAGLIIRRDSPNGKRYARKDRGGVIQFAFGFTLSPLVARAEEFEDLAAEIEADARALKLARERITLCRRDIAKMIAAGIEEGAPTRRAGQGPADWQEVHRAFRAIVDAIPRTATVEELEPIAETLSQLADDVANLLRNHINARNPSANESQNERHIQNSKPDSLIELEPCLRKGRAETVEPERQAPRMAGSAYPLGMVLNACANISDYAKGGISNWRDFLATAAVVRPMLGISPSAWEEAQAVMGEVQAGVVVACILERSATINSAGGYLRGLTQKAQAREFSLGPILMAQINARKREGKRRA
jgi:replication initiation protein RepC